MILLVDQLYSRQIFDNHPYTHLRALPERPDNMLTIMGPSKTESLSGFRLGTAFGTSWIIERMEKLQEFGPQFTHSFRVNFSQDPKNTHDAIDRVLQIMERYRSK